MNMMTEIDTVWLSALFVASGNVSASEIPPTILENFEVFVRGLNRRRLVALDEAFAFALAAMVEVDGTRAVTLTVEISAMRDRVKEILHSEFAEKEEKHG